MMLNYEEAKKYFRFIQRKHEKSVLKKDLESFNDLYDSVLRISSKEGNISNFVSYFSRAEKEQTIQFMKGGCGYFASLLDLLFGNEDSGFLVLTIGNKFRDKTPDSIKFNNEYEKMNIVGKECGFSHILYQHECKYYDACGEYSTKEDVLNHCKEYYSKYLKEDKCNLTGKLYLTEFKNNELWKVEKKDEIKKRGFVHYTISAYTSNLFDDINDMLSSMRQNFGRNEKREIVFKNNSYIRSAGLW